MHRKWRARFVLHEQGDVLDFDRLAQHRIEKGVRDKLGGKSSAPGMASAVSIDGKQAAE